MRINVPRDLFLGIFESLVGFFQSVRLRGELLFALLQVRNVGVNCDSSAVPGFAFSDQNPLTATALLDPGFTRVVMKRQTLCNPLVYTALCVSNVSILGSSPNDRFKRRSRLNVDVRIRVKQFLIPGVTKHQTVIRIEEREAFR